MKLKHLLFIAFIGMFLVGCINLPQLPTIPPAGYENEPPALPTDDQVGAGQRQHVAVTTPDAPPVDQVAANIDEALVGFWNARYSRMFYDAGGGGDQGSPIYPLELSQGGTWAFSNSRGQWSVAPITDADWAKWNVTAYGPTRKIVLTNWGGETVDGPIEETSEGVDFIWLIYHVEPPTVIDPGVLQTKFAHG